MARVPKNFWLYEDNRVRAIKWLLKKARKPPEKLVARDFHKNGVSTLIVFYGESVSKALREAGIIFDAWSLRKCPSNYFKKKENRLKALKWLLEKTGKKPCELKKKNFFAYGLYRLLDGYYKKLGNAVVEVLHA